MKSSPCFVIGMFAVSLVGLARAGQDVAVLETPPPAAADSGWQFSIQPYGWLTGMEGDTGVGPFVTELDQSFSDIFEYINMAAALRAEARKGRWGIMADGFYADLGGDGNPPGPVYDGVAVNIKQFIGELAVAYRIYESPAGFVDVYGGVRYNSLSLDFEASLDPDGIQSVSERAAARIVAAAGDRAEAISATREDDFQNAAAAERAEIENEVAGAVETAAMKRVKRDLLKQLTRLGRDSGISRRQLVAERIVLDVKAQRLELARSAAQLEVARLRASVDASLQGEVKQAQTRVDQSEKELADAISGKIRAAAPTSFSADKEWADPFLGVRGQWNFKDRWFLAGKSDIGGFGVGSDLVWTVEGTLGYRFNDRVSAEFGYRYMDTDFQDGAFTYDIAEHGFFTGLKFEF